MKMEVNIKYRPEKNDIIIFNGKEWVNISYNSLLEPLNKVIETLKNRITDLENEIKSIKGE